METKRMIQRINRTRNYFCEPIDKIDKPLVTLDKGHRDSNQIDKIRNENRHITTELRKLNKIHPMLVQKPIHYKLENLKERDDF